ncbi:hypothetical protein BH20ACT2_BH20ACT2_05500 [soil metagenome]
MKEHQPDAAKRDPGFGVERTVFVGLGVALVVSAVAYGLLSSEDAGTTMLLLAGALALTVGIYLWVQMRAGISPAADAIGDPAGPWFPHSSWWPFGVGVGAWLVCNGLILGTWALIPGAMVLALTVVGFIAQTRTRP